jgi:diguanylate cyclase (GGDEF)-like protein
MDAGSAPVRAVVVGVHSVQPTWRGVVGLELVRVPTVLEAVALLASEGTTRAGEVTAILVTPEARGDLSAGDWSQFRASCRLLPAAPRVLMLSRESMSECDGCLSPDAPGELLRAAVMGGKLVPAQRESASQGAKASPVVAPAAPMARVTTPSIGPPTAPSGSPTRDVGDDVLVRAVARGQDPLEPALVLVRARTCDASIDFQPATPGAPCPVVFEGRVLGQLISNATSPEVLLPHAAWLGAWIFLREQQAQLREAAFTDPLTGAYNRRYFDKFLSGVIEQSREQRRFVTILLFDIDNFKVYNDRFGHAAGDEVLSQTVKLMRSVIRPSDKVCRIGGDEFAVIFHDAEGPRQEGSRHPASVSSLAQRFQQQIREHRFPKLLELAPGTLTISGGLATYPWDGDTPAKLLECADARALESKRQGKNVITMGPGAGVSGAGGPGGVHPDAP